MYEALRASIDTLPLVDDHAHLGFMQAIAEMDYPKEEKLPYVDTYLTPGECSLGFPYLRQLHQEVYQQFYGFAPEHLEDTNRRSELSAAYEAKRRDLTATLDVFMKAGNVEHVISNLYLPKELESHPRISFIPTVDPLLYPFDASYHTTQSAALGHLRAFAHALGEMRREYGPPEDDSFAAYLSFAHRVLDGIKSKGCSGYKIASAYVRSLRFPRPTEAGEALYEKAKAGDHDAYTRFQDFMMWEIVKKAAENGMPVQLHTALVDGHIDHSDPLNLQEFLQDDATYGAKLVLLHAGYPLFDHAQAMAMAAKPMTQNSVYIDLSGRVMFGNHPAILAKMLRGFLENPSLWGKIIYGSDAVAGERFIYTCSRVVRVAVYLALSSMVEDGILDEPTAIFLAKNVLRNNAIRLYNLPLAIM